MGKHTHNKKKSLKKHHKDKKRKSRKHRHSSTDSSTEEEWVEKVQNDSSDEKLEKKKDKGDSSENSRHNMEIKPSTSRDEWMSLSTSFLSTSHLDKRKAKEEEKNQEREKQQYNPRECSRELNPYWKGGGDGLPKFKKPCEDNTDRQGVYKSSSNSKFSFTNTRPNWKKQKVDNHNVSKVELEVPKITQNTREREDGLFLSEKEMNQLAAKLVKAEIMGNTKLAEELNRKLECARENNTKLKEGGEDVLLTHTDSQGHSLPLKLQSDYENPSNHKRKKNIETHKDGQRIRYFADDDKYSLSQMFENEKFNTVEDHNREFIKMATNVSKNDDLDDLFSDNIRKKQVDKKIDEKHKSKAISEHHKMSSSLDKCKRCIQSESMLKHLMVSMTETAYISLPSFEPLTEGHCFIAPIRHVPCATQLDENEWHEISDIKKGLIKLFASQNKDTIFFESAMYLHKFPHMHIECIPLPKEDGDMAPIYFKKAIDESETEWAQNKKLVSLKARDVRRAIPKGLPYFSVSFGMEEGYAHVIEDEQMFPSNFAQEIIGGMLDLHHSKWRNPKSQNFEEQNSRVVRFSKEWSNFDCTVK